jgi:gluconolactonase
VFDQAGNLYVSDSGDFHHPHPGNGCIMKIVPDNTTTVFHAGPFMFANGLAIDPSGEWLYVVQSTASNVVRVSLAAPDREVRVAYRLPEDTVPDGLAFTTDDRLVISCYAPDIVYLGEPAGDGDGDGVGDVEVLVEDPSGALMNRPTNVALHDGRLYIASLGGWSITTVATDLVAAPLRRPDQPV